ncbi:MAG: dipeptidase [Eubacteriales bacterium]
MELSLIDTHCDTAYELYHRGAHLDRNDCHIDLEKASVFKHYAQYYAVWSDKRLDDEDCWQDFLKITEYFDKELAALSDRAVRVRTGQELAAAWESGKHAAILAVEDARLTAGKLERLDTLRDMGVRYLTLLWSGETCVGGSHNTQSGLTDFGKELVAGCFQRGIIPDISHASEQSVDDLIPIAKAYGKPFIATHSNAYTLCPVSRNLRDRHFQALKELGGVLGINLYTAFLTDTSVRPATVDDVVAHIDYFMALGGEDIIGLGGDLDGSTLPDSFHHVGDLYQIADALARHNYSEELIQKIFWKNFYDFAMKNL